MIHNIPKPCISPNFTIEDIHHIREWNYERLKDASVEERLADINARSAKALKRIKEFEIKTHQLLCGQTLNNILNEN